METGLLDVPLGQIRSVTTEHLLARLLEDHRKPERSTQRAAARPTLADAERLHAALVVMASNLRPILNIHPNIKLIPLWGVDAAGDCTCRSGHSCTHTGKHPWIEDWTNPEVGSMSVFTLATWLYHFGTGLNWGVKTGLLGVKDGREVHLVIVDVDTDDPGKQLYILEELEAQRTIVVRTQSGGLHLYYLSEREIPTKTKFMACVDTRGSRGQGVLPGSRGKEGFYSLAEGSPFYSGEVEYLGKEMEGRILSYSSSSDPSSRDGVHPPPSPPDLANGYDDIRPEGRSQPKEPHPNWSFWCEQQGSAKRMVEWVEHGKGFRIPCGCRNTALMRIACYLRTHRAFSRPALEAFLEHMRTSHVQSPETLGEEEIPGVVKYAMKFPARKTNKRRWTAKSGEPLVMTPEEELFFGSLEKSWTSRSELQDVVGAYQTYLVEVCGYRFTKTMDKNVVADVLSGLGFRKWRESVRGVDRYFWNVDPDSIPRTFRAVQRTRIDQPGVVSGAI